MIGQLGNLGQLGMSGGSRQLLPRQLPGCMWEYDLYNWGTLFQGKLGTTPVTNYGQPIGLQLDLSQGLVLGPEVVADPGFDDSTKWLIESSNKWTISNSKATYTGGLSAYISANNSPVINGKWYKIQLTISGLTSGVARIMLWGGVTAGFYFTVNLSNGTVSLYINCKETSNLRWYAVENAGSSFSIDNISVKEIPGNHRFSESAARPTLELSASGKPCLYYPGTGRYMQTNPFAWGSDEVCVIMGVRKLSDATTGFLLEYSINSTDQTNAFALVSPSTNGANSFRFYSHGNAPQVGAGTGVFAAAPTTKVIAGLGKISGDICRLYANGSLIESTLTDQGTGNYGTYALYFGARYGTGTPSLFFYGEEYSSCAFNKIPTDSQFLAVNRWANTKTGAY